MYLQRYLSYLVCFLFACTHYFVDKTEHMIHLRTSFDWLGRRSWSDFRIRDDLQHIPWWGLRHLSYRNDRGDNEKQTTCTCGREIVQYNTHNYYISGLPGHPGSYERKGSSRSIFIFVLHCVY